MRILVLTGLFPPYGFGGHEIHCREMSTKLQKRGFEIHILTSHFGVARPCVEGNVTRRLHAYGLDGMPDWPTSILGRAWRDWEDCRTLLREVESFRPDLVFIWVSHCLTRALFSVLARLDLPVVWQDGGDCVLKAVRRRGRWLRFCQYLPKFMLKRSAHRFLVALSKFVTRGNLPDRLVFPDDLTVYQCSDYSYRFVEERRSIPVKKHLFIHPGVDLFLFKPAPRRKGFPTEIRLLCPSRIHECKGQVNAVRALAHLRTLRPDWKVNLVFTGKLQDPAYGEFVRAEVASLGLNSAVAFLGMVPREKLCAIYHSCDIVLFTSIYAEPFGTVIAEAKACARPVVGSAVGGAVEQMQHGETAMIYGAGDVAGLGNRIVELCENVELYDWLAEKGRADIEKRFSMDRIADQVADLLRAVARPTKPKEENGQ